MRRLTTAWYRLWMGVIACGLFHSMGIAPSQAQDPRDELQEMGVSFNEESLIQAAKKGNPDVVQLFLQAGLSPDVQEEAGIGVDGKGRTPLILAAKNGHVRTVEVLLEGGADPNVSMPSRPAYSAIMFAAQNGNAEIVEILIENGGNPNDRGAAAVPTLRLAAQNGHAETVEVLLEGGADPNEGRGHKRPLMFAAQNGHVDVAKLLLDHGADIDKQDDDGKTPLFYAAENGNAETAELLLNHGANVNIRGENYGETPLISAAGEGDT